MKRIIALLLCVVFALSVIPCGLIFAEDTKSVSDAVVYLNGTIGSDSNSGKTAAKAVKTLAKAVEVANTFTNAENVTVVVTGITDLADKQHYILPANNTKITVTSKYNGTDYRENPSNACLTTFSERLSCIYFNGDFAFEYVRLIRAM